MHIKALVADWDDTITNDTIHLVADAAYETHPDFAYPWSHFKKVYGDAYDEYSSHMPPRSTIEQEWQYQKGLKDVEMSSVNEYVRLGLFKGVKTETLREQAKKVVIKDGSMERNGIVVDGDQVKIYTNEFEEVDGVLNGAVAPGRNIRTGVDKEEVMKIIMQEIGLSDGVVYMGDSSTDIFALRLAHTGIIVPGGSALSTLQRLNIPTTTDLQDSDIKIKCIDSWEQLLPHIK
ncbi:putative aminopyrimidine aminohydrolase, mitochondrial [Cyberlindnera fabianii]|uniref:Putative aminopyrimidine aminohydrolase, mitochondrial n=1 Tax=Cyberlindnera fabianii TaxID=36022 RepID=A0A1V2LCI7_CYBFA|nr:putative aminopyrimidine aminohydrolase, mitochondrial [Cyberlindnera fabianii]